MMEEKLLETIVGTFISEIITDSKNIFNDLVDEGNQLLKTGIKRYLNKQKDKYSYLKTLLKGNSPVYLYDIYFPLKLAKWDKLNKLDKHIPGISTNSIKSLFTNSNYLTIIGEAGSGKSTLVKHLFLNSIQTSFAIPILVELRYLNDYDYDLESYILDKVLENEIAENRLILERLLQKGKFVFFLDGYDELNSEVRSNTVEDLNVFINKYSENKFLLTSRPYSNVEHLQLFHNFAIKNLSFYGGEIKGFIHKQLDKEIELAKKIVSSLKWNRYDYINSFLTNPLLLSLYILTFQSNADIPAKKYIFYRRVIQALFSEHDSKTKLGYIREKQSGLKQEEFENILRSYCFLSYFESHFSWDLDYINDKFDIIKKTKKIDFSNEAVLTDFKSALAIWIEDYGMYSFAHRSLQEYFAALFVKSISPDHIERTYKKMIDRFSKIREFTEVQNFLSILEEMDTLNFKRYYYYPLLNEVRSYIDTSNDQTKIISFLNFFASGITLSSDIDGDKIHGTIEVNNDIVFRSVFVHIPFTTNLRAILQKATNIEKGNLSKGNDTKLSDTEVGGGHLIYINFKKELPSDFKSACFPDILKTVNDMIRFIKNEKRKTKQYISNAIDMDKDFVDLL